MSDLAEFVESPGRFMEPSPGVLIAKTARFVVVGGTDGVWASVQGVRLRDGEASDVVAEVRSLLPSGAARVVSWWLSELATPDDVEQQLLNAGLRLVPHDYLLDGLLATAAPPAGPPDVEVYPAASAEEWAEIRELQDGVFGTPQDRRATRDRLLREFGNGQTVLLGARLDGELVGAGGATPTSRGLLLWGGSVRADARGHGCYRALVRARWDGAVRRGTPALTVSANDKSGPVLRRLGFEKVLQFRRIEDVLSGS